MEAIIDNCGSIFLVLGILYAIKLLFKFICNIFEAFKTFILPLICSRNFPEEYGSWAGKLYTVVAKKIQSRMT